MVNSSGPDALAQDFVQFAVDSGVLRFGEFKTKAGRLSPYFFNAGGFDDGAKLGRLAQFYAQRILASKIEFDMIFGPAYKGIALAAAVDDVMSAGTAARESIAIIRAAGATPHAVAIALDRQEMATENGRDVTHSAVQYVRDTLGLQVCAIARLADLLQYLEKQSGNGLGSYLQQVAAYRERYGVE
jgi:orotate phosphoribosyltransferase